MNLNENSLSQPTVIHDQDSMEMHNITQGNDDDRTLPFIDNTSQILQSAEEPSQPDSPNNSTSSPPKTNYFVFF